jgi:hypothetical protein
MRAPGFLIAFAVVRPVREEAISVEHHNLTSLVYMTSEHVVRAGRGETRVAEAAVT